MEPPGTTDESELDAWLRFRESAVEADYQRHAADEARPGQSAGFVVGAALWVVGSALAATVAGVDTRVAAVVGVAMVAVNLVAAVVHRPVRTLDGQQRIVVTTNVLALVAAMVIIDSAGAAAFDRFAGPVVMLISIFAFVLLRVRFTYAVVAGIAYLVTFTLFGIAVGMDAPTVQLFLVGSSVAVAVSGAYLVERSARRLFAAGRRIDALSTRLDELLRRYLSPGLASSLIDRPALAELGGQVTEVTILFADVQGFTPFAERTDPAATVARLNDYYGAAVPAVLAEGGTVVGFAGDALMAIFNAPSPLADHALHAARAALSFRDAAAGLSRGDDDLRFRIGLNSGPALVGNVGSQELRNFTAIGDTANLAARLQTAAMPGSIVIGPTTRTVLGDAAVVRDLGPLELKGKSEPVHAWELLHLATGP